jgi:tetratricopeptide (TPR) repeat protein
MRMVAVSVMVALAGTANGRAESMEDARRLLAEGEQRFERGLSIAEKDREASHAHFRAAATAWASLREGGIQNAKLEYNIANAWMLTGDYGRAIASYRRALVLEPGNAVLREGLEAARRRAGVVAPAEGVRTIARRGVDLARRAQGVAPPGVWIGTAGVLWMVGWAALGARVVWRTRGMGRLALGSWALAGLAIGAPVSDALDQRTSTLAVVVSKDVVARTGPSEGVYEPAFKEPLRAGLEVRIRERRGAWARVALPENREAWVRWEQIEVI